MAAIRVQLVKYIVHLLDGTGWAAAWGARRVDHSMPAVVSHVGGHIGRLSAAVSAAAEIAATRPSGSSAPRSSKATTPLHSKVQPWPGYSVVLRAAHQSIALADGHAGSWVHMMAVHSGCAKSAG
jgi:hypothetical protein